MVGVMGGVEGAGNVGQIVFKRLTIVGSALRPRSAQDKAAIAAELRATVWPLIDSGAIRPRIEATFPLARAADAHRLMESNRLIGKIVLEVADETS